MRLIHARGGQPTIPGVFVRLSVALALALVVAAGCAHSPAAIPLEPAFTGKDAVIEAFLAGLKARDRAAVEQLALTESEFRKHVWPALPASDPTVGMPLDYLWEDLAQKNEGFVSQLMAEHGGRDYRLVVAAFSGATTDHGGFRVHRKTTLDVRGPEGPVTLRLFGSMIESGGRWKIYSFVVD